MPVAHYRGRGTGSPRTIFHHPLERVLLSNILLIYNINTILNRQVTRIKKVSGRGFLVDPIPNSPNLHHRNCMTDSKEKY